MEIKHGEMSAMGQKRSSSLISWQVGLGPTADYLGRSRVLAGKINAASIPRAGKDVVIFLIVARSGSVRTI